MKDTSVTLKYRVERLETCNINLEQKIDKIMNNYLFHIQMSIIELKTRINVFTAINIGAVVTALLIQGLS